MHSHVSTSCQSSRISINPRKNENEMKRGRLMKCYKVFFLFFSFSYGVYVSYGLKERRKIGRHRTSRERGRERIETVTLEGHQQLRPTYSWRKGRRASPTCRVWCRFGYGQMPVDTCKPHLPYNPNELKSLND